MKPSIKKKTEYDFTAAVGRALKRSAKEARRLAKMHGTKIWVMQDGKVMGLEP